MWAKRLEAGRFAAPRRRGRKRALDRTALLALVELGAERVGVAQGLRATCTLQGVDPYAYLADVLQRVGRHPASRAVELMPRVRRTLFADDPRRSGLDKRPRPARELAGADKIGLCRLRRGSRIAAAPFNRGNASRPSLTAYITTGVVTGGKPNMDHTSLPTPSPRTPSHSRRPQSSSVTRQ